MRVGVRVSDGSSDGVEHLSDFGGTTVLTTARRSWLGDGIWLIRECKSLKLAN